MTAPRPIVIRGGRVVAPSHMTGAHADVLVIGDTIAEIGPPGLAAPADSAVIDAAGRLLIPGLINAHAHTHLVLAKAMAREWSLELHLNAGPYTSGNRTHADRNLSAKLLAVELIRSGCTACYDMFTEPPLPSPEGVSAVAQGYIEAGMRAVITPLMADRLFWDVIPGLREKIPADWRAELGMLDPPSGDAMLAAYDAVLARWSHDSNWVRPALAPLIPHHCSDAFLAALGGFARDHAMSLHIHLAESKVQAIAGQALYGTTLTRHLDRLGLVNERFIAGHAIWIDDDDIRCLADRGALVTHNPTSNLRLGSGLAPVRRLVEAGVTVGIGTDTPSCSDDLNMFLAVRSAAYVARAQTPEFDRWLDAATVFRMATRDGARVLGWPELGDLAPGFKADIVFLDLDSYAYTPLNNIVEQLVYAENGGSVESVMVGGRLVLDRGRITTLDEARLRADARLAAERLAHANADRRSLSARLETIVGPHCLAMSRQPYHVTRHAAGVGY